LHGLRQSKAAEEFLLRHLFLTYDFSLAEKQQKAADFMAQNDLTFPIVLKPDVGARGRGVHIIKTPEALFENLTADENQILQEFAAGEEASIFYYRYPNEEKGRLFAVTEKRFPHVTGDGEATLEELILRDSRAVCLAAKYLERNAERLETVPAAGEKVQIVDIGNHSHGAIYLDGGWLKTDVLENKIHEICRDFEGFYFGRFDIRGGSFAELREAKNFKIVELNGVASDATKIYDSKNSLFEAYRSLFRQWKIAFEIGAENRRRGVAPTKISDFIKLVLGKPIRNPQTEIRNQRCV
jgi:hypothetical protein